MSNGGSKFHEGKDGSDVTFLHAAMELDSPWGASAEGRPDNTGVEMARELNAAKIPVKLILDVGVAFFMEKVDMVLVGAEGVVESGGIINYLGTFQTALVPRSMNKPVYVAAESYKFARLYPLDQNDMISAPVLTIHLD